MTRSYLNTFNKLTQRHVISFVLFVSLCTSILIVTNYYTLKTVSAVRAYIHGESQYSKEEKDASRNLIMYINTEEKEYWNKFQNSIKVPLGDSIARVELTKKGEVSVIREGLLTGRNHEEDVNNMIWLFNNFSTVPFMKKAIETWKEADRLIGIKIQLGDRAHQLVENHALTEEFRKEIIASINTNTTALTLQERDFSDNLGAAARKINTYLFYFNFLMTVLIIGMASGYAVMMIKKLKKQNNILITTNNELDRFVYSASHDLRAPITSLRGLIEIAKEEKDPKVIEQYLNLMKESLDKQDEFIREIIDFSRNKGKEVAKQPVNLAKTIDQVIRHHCYMPNANEIQFTKDIELETIPSDPLRIEIILNNLISNAIKYSDQTKEKMTIHIKTYLKNHFAIMEIADNGVGIKKENLSNIFKMFYVTQNSNKGTGLGLYITQETVSRLQGSILVESELHKGTKFTLQIPMVS
jgi:signal transduction histidine kinase